MREEGTGMRVEIGEGEKGEGKEKAMKGKGERSEN